VSSTPPHWKGGFANCAPPDDTPYHLPDQKVPMSPDASAPKLIDDEIATIASFVPMSDL
jgi:hypothetical protein